MSDKKSEGEVDFYSIIQEKEPLHDAEKINHDAQRGIKFYCQVCKKPVTVLQLGKKLKFKCKECKSKKISYGTSESIHNYYKLN